MKKLFFIFCFYLAITTAQAQPPDIPTTFTVATAQPPSPPSSSPMSLEYGIVASLIMGTFLLFRNILDKMSETQKSTIETISKTIDNNTISIQNNTKALQDLEKVMDKHEERINRIEDGIEKLINQTSKQ